MCCRYGGTNHHRDWRSSPRQPAGRWPEPVREAAALSSGCVAVLKDITGEWKYQEMQKEFVANVSHELKTPLALIQGYLEALMDGLTGDPGSEERFLNIIHQETARLIRMVNDLLALAELDRGERTTEPVNLEKVAREMLVLAEKEAAKKNLRLVLEVAPEGVAGRAGPGEGWSGNQWPGER